MNETSDGDIGAIMVALLRECAAFEPGLANVRMAALRNVLMRISHGEMTDSEFNKMLAAPSIIKPEDFLPTLQAVRESMPPISNMILREAFEEILSAGGPLSKGATVLIDVIRKALIY